MARASIGRVGLVEHAILTDLGVRVAGEQLQAVEYLEKKLPDIPEDGWYIKSVRPATHREIEMWAFIMRDS